MEGPDRRERDPAVPATRDAGGSAPSPSSHPHQEVPGKCCHCHLVQDIHVGRHIPQVGLHVPLITNLM